ncbi:MAG: DUF4880 domain-containing protein [Comamonadaceae bacterium]|nr:MAG: DUF4880 domain-containing protein [Comamonadaceae bacterium]
MSDESSSDPTYLTRRDTPQRAPTLERPSQQSLPHTQTSLADQAVQWLVRLRAGQASESDLHAFEAWRSADVQHEAAWKCLTVALSTTLGDIGKDFPRTLSAPSPLWRDRATRALSGRRRFIALTGAALGVTGAAIAARQLHAPLESLGSVVTSGTGERKQVTLSDGTDILLDARSRIDVAMDATHRHIELQEGAVSLHVPEAGPRPLVIRTLQGEVTATHARVMVRQELGRTLVVVLQNSAHVVARSGLRLRLDAGTGVRFDPHIIDTVRTDLIDDAAWQVGAIQVRARTLLHVINTLRPYHYGVLRVSSAAGGLIVTGRYTLDNVGQTLATLASQLPITVRKLTPWLIWVDVAAA